ncbi:type IA DNA topoisomerase [Pseudodesulfovibrio pelocollis]|uniref:type IA DNA topoisomerase n=1 Tax=Pseudodesulfovibrio pelocollis TaxID=3051432 RepID=UPI00255A9CC7|nr:type IA DNA topoisomerase [Pseudodesulfovibrio sp. SB368]
MSYRKNITVKSLIVAENIDVAKAIAQAIDAEWNGSHFENTETIIIWLVDNILRYLSPENHDPAWSGMWTLDQLPMLPGRLLAQPVKDTQEHFKKVRALFQREDVDHVICATNPEEEGERVFRLLRMHLGSKTRCSRFWPHSMAPSEIRRAIASAGSLEPLDKLAARSFIKAETDWLVTMNMSRLVAIVAQTRDVVINRYTPILAILAKRHRKMEACAAGSSYQVAIACIFNGSTFDAHCVDPQSLQTLSFSDNIKAKKIFKDIESRQAVVQQVKRFKESKLPPKPFNTVDMIATANSVLGFAASKTMAVAKSLYEQHRAISFYKTAGHQFAKNKNTSLQNILAVLHPYHIELVEKILERLNAKPHFVDDLFTANEFDEVAISPTEVPINVNELNTAEKSLYALICKQFIASLLPPEVTLCNENLISVGKHLFKAQNQKSAAKAWTTAADWNAEEEKAIPFLVEGDELEIIQTNILEVPSYTFEPYTEASLLGQIKKYENEFGLNNAICKQAPSLIEYWGSRNLLERNGREILITEKGLALIKFLEEMAKHIPEMNLFCAPDSMCYWASELVSGFEKYPDEREAYRYAMGIVQEYLSIIVESCREKKEQLKLIRLVTPELGKCPICDETVVETPAGYKCSSKAKCPLFLSRKAFGATLTSSEAKKLLSEGKTSPLRCFSKKKNKHYTASLEWDAENKCLKPVFDSGGLGLCPACKKGQILERKNNFGCSAFRENGCNFFINKYDGEGGFTKEALQELLETKRTKKYYTFSKKDQKTYQAKLKLELDGEITFIYKNKF